MAYTRQNFTNGQQLDAKHLINMEDAILELYDLVKKSQLSVQTVDNALVVTQELATIQVEEG
jgi:hypothetical protein